MAIKLPLFRPPSLLSGQDNVSAEAYTVC